MISSDMSIRCYQTFPNFVFFVPFVVPIFRCQARHNLKGIDWVIGGGESGVHPRPMQQEWVTSIRDQCEKHDVAFFFKQWGGRNQKAAGRALDGIHHDTLPESCKTGRPGFRPSVNDMVSGYLIYQTICKS
jgi:protein gp37